MDIQHFAKTQEGVALLETQQPFVVNGQVWQGFHKTPFKVHEDQLTDDEMKDAVDVDGTKKSVWATRMRRLEERVGRKNKEYMARLTKLRQERSAIKQSLKEDRDMGLEDNPAALAEIAEIDRRMLRITQHTQARQLAVAITESDKPNDAVEVAASADVGVECKYCGKECPSGHANPQKWQIGHQMGCKDRPRK